MKSTATGKREVAVRYGGIKLSEGRQQGAQGRAKVRKDVAVLERQDRLGNKEKEAKGRGLWGHGCVNDPDLLVTHQIKHLCSLFCANCTTTKSVKRLFEMIINRITLSELSHGGSDVADAGAIPAVSPCVSQRPGLALFHQGRAPQFWQRAGKRGHQREGHE